MAITVVAKMRSSSLFSSLLLGAGSVLACSGCEGTGEIVMTRNVRRMQPDARNATTGPKAPLAWGQLNFLHTTDTHGWLEGHIKEGKSHREAVREI